MTLRRVLGFVPAALWIAGCEPKRETPARTQPPPKASPSGHADPAPATAAARPADDETVAQQDGDRERGSEPAPRPTDPMPPDPAPWTITVADGSGNVTTFDASATGSVTWSYDPVTPAESSSGTYSGGTPATGELTTAQVQTLWSLVRSAKGQRHERGRTMGTSLLKVESSTDKRTLDIPSSEARDLEDWMRSIRQGSSSAR